MFLNFYCFIAFSTIQWTVLDVIHEVFDMNVYEVLPSRTGLVCVCEYFTIGFVHLSGQI